MLKEMEELEVILQLEMEQIGKIKKRVRRIRNKKNWWIWKVRWEFKD